MKVRPDTLAGVLFCEGLENCGADDYMEPLQELFRLEGSMVQATQM